MEEQLAVVIDGGSVENGALTGPHRKHATATTMGQITVSAAAVPV